MQRPSAHVGHPLRVLRSVRHKQHPASVYGLGLRWGWKERRSLRDAERFVLFVGYGFSGHTLLGSLLNAHPDVVISHELDVLRFLDSGLGRNQLLGLIRYRDTTWEARGRVQNDYSYLVPGQWQGRARRVLVIGDKKGGRTTMRLAEKPELLEQLRDEIRLPLRVVHVTRSPLDNIGSMLKTMPYSLTEAVGIWRRQVETAAWVSEQLDPEELLVVATEDVKAEPARHLRELCAFLGVQPDDDYVAACAAFVDPAPSRSRNVVSEWPATVLEEIEQVTAAHPFLQLYVDDLQPSSPV